jgi:hypothetical protein
MLNIAISLVISKFFVQEINNIYLFLNYSSNRGVGGPANSGEHSRVVLHTIVVLVLAPSIKGPKKKEDRRCGEVYISLQRVIYFELAVDLTIFCFGRSYA